jgi:hypothetical protein
VTVENPGLERSIENVDNGPCSMFQCN